MAELSANDPEKIPEQILGNHDDHETNESKNFLQPVHSSSSIHTPPVTPPSENMASGETKQKQPKNRRFEESREFWQHMTTAAHASILLFVILIIYFCFSEKFEFFTWHPLLLSTGWMFLMTEAILSISKDNLFTGTLSKLIRVRLHWIFQVIALICIKLGFAVVFINKNMLNKSHFQSWHALLGFIGIVFTIPTCINGVAALYHGDLRHYIRPKINKFIHILSGIITFGFGGMALILSVYTKWFARHSNESILTFIVGLGLAITAVAWTLLRPVITCSNQLRHLK